VRWKGYPSSFTPFIYVSSILFDILLGLRHGPQI
jgi:hypothetical protein